MRQLPFQTILNYKSDPTFNHYYFRDDIIKSKDQILNIYYKDTYYYFSIERLTIRSFNTTDYKLYNNRKEFINMNYRVVVYLEGENAIYKNDKLVDCNSHNVLLLSPGIQTSITAKIPKSYSVLEFNFNLLDNENKSLEIPFVEYLEVLTGKKLIMPDIITLSDFNKKEIIIKFNQILSNLKHKYNSPAIFNNCENRDSFVINEQFNLNLLILETFNIFIKYLENDNLTNGEYVGNLENVVNVMTEEYKKQFNIDELAEIAGLSKHYFHSKFKSVYKITPLEYLNRLRIKQAMLILANSTLNCNEVGSRVGINNPFYFSKIFKKYVGITPSAYRKMNRPV